MSGNNTNKSKMKGSATTTAMVLWLLFYLCFFSGMGEKLRAQQPNKPDYPRLEQPTIFMEDDREYIAVATKFPYSAIVRLKVTFPNGRATWASGALIGPNKVITAEHAVYNESYGGHASIVVQPGYSTGKTSCNPTVVVHLQHGAHQGCHDGANCDIAVLTTQDDVGCNTGWFGFKEIDYNNLQGLNIAGYPQDRGFGQEMYVIKTNARHTLGYYGEHNIISYPAWTSGGMSGGPIFTDDYYIVGIHDGGSSQGNFGVAICNQLYSSVYGWWSS